MFVPSFEALAAREVLLSARNVSSRASPLAGDVLRSLISLLQVSHLSLRLAFSKVSHLLLSRRKLLNKIIAAPMQRASIRACAVMVEIKLSLTFTLDGLNPKAVLIKWES